MIIVSAFGNLKLLAAVESEGGHREVELIELLWLGLGALGAFVALLTLSIILLMWLRKRNYSRQNSRDTGHMDRELSPDLEAVYKGLKRKHWIDLHEETNRKQSHYWILVYGYSSAILLAFVFLVPAVTLCSYHHSFAVFVAWFELFCFLTMLLFYFRGRRVNSAWIWMRARAELLRQASILAAISMKSTVEVEKGAATGENSTFDRLKEEVERCFGPAAHADGGKRFKFPGEKELDRAIDAYQGSETYQVTVEEISQGRNRDGLLASAAVFYYFRRFVRQESWFKQSEHRLEGGQERREAFFLILFFVGIGSVAAKICKYAHVLPAFLAPNSSILSAILLLITALAGCMAASSLNSNSRSLVHKYRLQRRMFASLRKRLEPFDPEKIRDEQAMRLLGLVPEFEDLMIMELQEWVVVTARDRLELGP